MAESTGSDQSNGSGSPAPPASLPPNPTPAVFISYASQDAAVADALCAALEQAGIACWIAPRNVRPGDFYADAIGNAINACPVLVLLLSKNSVDSAHVLREVERASAKKRPVIAFRIDTTSLPPGLEYFLSASQWIDASSGTPERGFPKLVEALRGRISSPPNSEAGRPTVQLPSRSSSNRVVIVVVAVGAAALLFFVIDKFWLSNRAKTEQAAISATASQAPVTPSVPTISDKSIAVLPFTDMSEKKDQEYFADGMAEEILDILAKVPSLKVIGRTSSFQFKGRNEDLRAIGAKLGVAYLLEGSVRRSADGVRVTAQLIDTRDGAHVWSETYERRPNDVLGMQGEIATTVARSLEIGVGADRPQSPRRLTNDAAYDLYLRGRYASERGDADGLATGVTYLRQALDADPNFADAAVALALTYYQQAYESVAPSGVFELARRAAESALKLNPQLGLAHAILGAVHSDYDWDWSGADREFKEAIALAPHDGRVLTIAADLPVALGQLDAARQMLKEALAYDPLLADAYSSLDWTEWCSGRYEEMLDAARKVLDIAPDYGWGHTYVGLALIYRGNPAAALAEIKRDGDAMGQAWGLALAYHALGRAVDSNAALKRLIAGGASNDAYEIAELYAYRGERDEALKWLDRAYAQKDGTLKWISRDPTMATLQLDPRYIAFLRKMNLPE